MSQQSLAKLVIAAICSLLLVPATASAEEKEHKGFGGATISFFTKEVGTISTTHITTKISGAYYVMPQVMVSADWALPWTSMSDSSGTLTDISDFGVGNPFVAAHYYFMKTKAIHASAGLGLGLPVATIPTDDLEAGISRAANLGTALGVSGLQAAWLYLPDTFSVVIPIHGQLHFKSGLEVGGEIVYAVFLPTEDNADGTSRPTDMAFELALDAAFDAGMVAPGVRFALAYEIPGEEENAVPTTEEEDHLQLVLEPFVKVDLGKAFARIGFAMTLDNPLGWAFNDPSDPEADMADGPGYWALNVGGGTYF